MKTCLSFSLIIYFLIVFTNDLLPQRICASHNKAKVDSLVWGIDSTAKLYWIQSGDSLSLDGKTTLWYYWYMATSGPVPPMNYYLHTTRDSVIIDSLSSFFPLSHLEFRWISKPWIDSDSAMVLAEQQGGTDFRMHHDSYIIGATLLEQLDPRYWWPDWRIWYVAMDSTNVIQVFNLDATDNHSSFVREQGEARSCDIVLNQNYPNPFNPRTTITFSIARSQLVHLTIHNILGQQICSLLSQRLPPGRFEYSWDGTHQASGVYYYRLQVDDRVLYKPMILLK